MLSIFRKAENLSIDSRLPNVVTSQIDVADLEGDIQHLTVTVDILHTFTRDLQISVTSPDGTRVVLVDRRGGSGDNFSNTTFDDRSQSSIRSAIPPFRGSFQPERPLSQFEGRAANGVWTLEVSDRAFLDGGMLNSWQLAITTQRQSNFNIEVEFGNGLSTSQQDVFAAAAARWSEIIVGDIPDVNTPTGVVDDVVIEAQGVGIDGPHGVLGQAGPTVVRVPSRIPARGIMSFDTADLMVLEGNGSLLDVIIHEMGHVLGIGTIWQDLNLLQGAGTANPVFIGSNAMREFGRLTRTNSLSPVPVANTGGPGTADGHWRESVFGNELMTGFLDSGTNPISRLTVGALEDMGYDVEYAAAETFGLPSALELAIMGVQHVTCCRCRTTRPDYVEVECDI